MPGTVLGTAECNQDKLNKNTCPYAYILSKEYNKEKNKAGKRYKCVGVEALADEDHRVTAG